jgi:MoaA/NifB/PqqE/SkfB family radical SAM enzyme
MNTNNIAPHPSICNIVKSNIRHFNLELTKKCNQKCFYCFNDSGYAKSKDELSLAEWKNSISEIHNLGYKSVHITGGEPFLHPNIVEILSHSIELGLETTILSNGFKISSLVDKHPSLFTKLKLAQISLDSMDAEMHNSRRGFRNAFKDAMDAINALKKVNVPIEISTTVSEQNLLHLTDIAKYCNLIKAALIIRPLIQAGRAQSIEHSTEFNIQLEGIKERLKSQVKANIISDKFNYVADEKESDRYFKEFGTVTVEATGNIRGEYMKSYILNNFLSQLKAA